MPEHLTPQMIQVMAVIGLVVILFVTEVVRVDVVGMLMMVLLPLMGLVTPLDAFAGLSSNAVVSIIGVMIVGRGLDKTGVAARMMSPALKLSGGSRNRLLALISSTVAGVSSIMQNVGAAALVLPAVQRLSRQENIPLAKLLMPIGFSAILGGTLTLVGSSPLILLNDLTEPFLFKRYGFFSVTPIGLALVASGIAYFILLGRWVLPGRGEEDSYRPQCFDHPSAGRHYEMVMHVKPPQPLTARIMRSQYRVKLVAMIRAGGREHVMVPDPRSEVRPGDVMAVVGDDENVTQLAHDFGLDARPGLKELAYDLIPSRWGVVESAVGPRSALSGLTLARANFRSRFRLNVLAVYRGQQAYEKDPYDLVLKPGDILLLEGPWDRVETLAQSGLLIFCTPMPKEEVPVWKAALAAFWLVLGLVLVMVFNQRLSVGLMTAALGMILTRIVNVQEAYDSVDWRTIFLLAGLMPLGVATMKTGTAHWLAREALALLGPGSPVLIYLGLGLLTTLFTLVVSNVGATVLLVPLAVHIAIESGADPRAAALLVTISASNSFLLPTHQVNALYMGPGRYHASDYLRAGSGMSLIFLVVAIAMLYLAKGFY